MMVEFSALQNQLNLLQRKQFILVKNLRQLEATRSSEVMLEKYLPAWRTICLVQPVKFEKLSVLWNNFRCACQQARRSIVGVEPI